MNDEFDKQMQMINETFMDCDEKCDGWANGGGYVRTTKW